VNNNRWILLCGTLVLLAFTGCIPEEEDGSVLDVYNPRADWGEGAPGDGANAEPIGDQFNAVAGDEVEPASEEDPPKSGSEEDQPADADEQDDAAEDSGGGSEDGFLIAYFDTDGHASQGFDGYYAAEGRIGSTAAKKNHTFELGLGEDSGAPTVQSDFDWKNGEPHSFHIVWDTATVSFQVDDVVLETAFACEPINAVNVRCRANKGVIEVFDLAINDRGIPQSVTAASDPGNDLSIMRIEGDFGDALTRPAGWPRPSRTRLPIATTTAWPTTKISFPEPKRTATATAYPIRVTWRTARAATLTATAFRTSANRTATATASRTPLISPTARARTAMPTVRPMNARPTPMATA